MSIEYQNVRIVQADRTIENGCVLFEGTTITEVAEQNLDKGTTLLDGQGLTLFPGFIDVHVHGANGHDVMDATPEALRGIAEVLPEEGTTSFLATTMTQSKEAIERALTNAGAFDAESVTGAEMLGVHLEGPFIAEEKSGAQPVEHILSPAVSTFEAWRESSNDKIKMVTLAPEKEGADKLISHLRQDGIIASIGHTSATFDQAKQAVDRGVGHVTHLYNQMSGLHHRDPGVVGAAFTDPRLMVELIVDHIHSTKEAVQIAYHQITHERLLLITDAMRAKCLKEGTYDLGGQDVTVKGKQAVLEDGTLAGSILKFKEAAGRMKDHLHLSDQELLSITSLNAARELGVDDRKGEIAAGKDADFVLIDSDFNIQATWARGSLVYEREGES
ncbi:N-acetylglucosamine-6-phosphate deacetylase [Salimicrobium halophilum]|uniref:N-acetylglucosamine-6-phosphate deacetylase n=1 Tax=Salimicrobium halophilum TaxID=86666 RepID=A0A1G8SRH3_9BACI|nr:N-acetylglucosamine-6-phosphate deacetylase [Salimicrobium halophilum]SDJ31764.1 N-acetylglucosamine-6-phosphate deacetylase [Salimicrobium halophilum]